MIDLCYDNVVDIERTKLVLEHKLKKEDGHWLYGEAKVYKASPLMKLNDKVYSVRVLAWMIYVEKLREGERIKKNIKACRVGNCVNPEHLKKFRGMRITL
jgi:hypothetical protein